MAACRDLVPATTPSDPVAWNVSLPYLLWKRYCIRTYTCTHLLPRCTWSVVRFSYRDAALALEVDRVIRLSNYMRVVALPFVGATHTIPRFTDLMRANVHPDDMILDVSFPHCPDLDLEVDASHGTGFPNPSAGDTVFRIGMTLQDGTQIFYEEEVPRPDEPHVSAMHRDRIQYLQLNTPIVSSDDEAEEASRNVLHGAVYDMVYQNVVWRRSNNQWSLAPRGIDSDDETVPELVDEGSPLENASYSSILLNQIIRSADSGALTEEVKDDDPQEHRQSVFQNRYDVHRLPIRGYDALPINTLWTSDHPTNYETNHAEVAPGGTPPRFVCTICKTHLRNVVCLPCGHLCACGPCFRVVATDPTLRTCPVCREPMSKVTKAFV